MGRTVYGLLILLLLFSVAGAESLLPPSKKINDEDGDRIYENLRDRMQRVAATEEIPVLIVYKEGLFVADTLMRENHIPQKQVKYTYQYIPAMAARLSSLQIEQLAKDSSVEHIELDAKLRICMGTAKASFGVKSLKKQFGFTGDGDGILGNYSSQDMVIAVADTGVDTTHPDLQGKVLYWKDYINNRTSPYDDEGHGTHVAGVAAGSGKLSRRRAGVAPQAALVAFKTVSMDGEGDASDTIAAIDEAIARRLQFNIRVFNLSLEASGSSDGKDVLSLACDRAVQNGIVMVVAAGNQGPGKRTIGAGAASALSITVGAGADTGENGFYLAGFSSRGPTADGRVKPDLWGPGIRISAPKLGTGYSALDGTSFSAPFVAGVAALMLDANPNLTPAEIKTILLQTCADWAPRRKTNDAGAGRLQAYQAVTTAASITTNLNPPIIPELFFVKKRILVGQTQTYTIPVVGLKYAIAITAVVYNFPAAQLRLELISPTGNTLSASTSLKRQATIVLKPLSIGNYTLRITDSLADTKYLLDISTDMAP